MKLWSEIISPQSLQKDKVRDIHKNSIVFLHGTGSNARMWRNQVEFLSRHGHTCVTIDLRGHGFSHEPYEPTSLETHLTDVSQTLQNNDIVPAYFVGHSLGAIIALFLAQRKPELVKGVFAAALPGRIYPSVRQTFQFFLNGPQQALKDSEIKRYLGWRWRTIVETSPFTLNQIQTHFADIDLIGSLPEIACPVHLACGRFDLVATYWHAKQLQQKLPGSTLKIFEWGGHNFMDHKPDAFNAWILTHLK